jgi:hypothetical protein
MKQKDARKIWVKVKNILKKHLNIEALNSDSCLKHFCMLFTKEDRGLLLNESQNLGPDYTDELDDDFIVQEVTKCILSMKNKKGAGRDCIPAETWKIFLSNAE